MDLNVCSEASLNTSSPHNPIVLFSFKDTLGQGFLGESKGACKTGFRHRPIGLFGGDLGDQSRAIRFQYNSSIDGMVHDQSDRLKLVQDGLFINLWPKKIK